MPRSTRTLAAVALALLVVFAGCSGGAGGGQELASGGGDGAGGGGGGDSGAPAEASDAEGEARMGSQSAAFKQETRALIRTGSVELEVEDFDAARRRLVRETRDLGGFVAGSSQTTHRIDNETWTSGRLVLRVPSEDFSELVERINATGQVRHAEMTTQDVTDQLVDINARLKSLRAQRERLRTLYQQANDTEAVLKVQERLSEVQTEIERLEARKRGLRDRVAFSTVTVELSEPRPTPAPEPVERWYDTPVVAAFLESVDGVWVVLRALSVALAYAAPYLLTFGVPLAAVAFVARRRVGVGERIRELLDDRLK